MREQQLADLTRGYDQSKANYDDLLKKKNESEMATSMERLQQGERFRVLDPPGLPSKPDFPNRLKFCGMGLGVGIMLGLVVAGGFEFMDDRMHSEQEIKDLMPVGIMVEIPEVLNFSDQQTDQEKNALYLGHDGTGGNHDSGGFSGQLSLRLSSSFHVQSFLQSHAKSLRAHARPGFPVRDQAAQ